MAAQLGDASFLIIVLFIFLSLLLIIIILYYYAMAAQLGDSFLTLLGTYRRNP